MNQDSILYIELPLEKILKTTRKKKGGARASKKEILKCFNNKSTGMNI